MAAGLRTWRSRGGWLALLLAVLALVAFASVASTLILAPALVLLAILMLGCFPGELVMARLARRLPVRRRRAVSVPSGRRAPAGVMARGSALLGHALAVRPPPAA